MNGKAGAHEAVMVGALATALLLIVAIPLLRAAGLKSNALAA